MRREQQQLNPSDHLWSALIKWWLWLRSQAVAVVRWVLAVLILRVNQCAASWPTSRRAKVEGACADCIVTAWSMSASASQYYRLSSRWRRNDRRRSLWNVITTSATTHSAIELPWRKSVSGEPQRRLAVKNDAMHDVAATSLTPESTHSDAAGRCRLLVWSVTSLDSTPRSPALSDDAHTVDDTVNQQLIINNYMYISDSLH